MLVKTAFISDNLANKLKLNNINNLIFQLKVSWENKVQKTVGCLSVTVEVCMFRMS